MLLKKGAEAYLYKEEWYGISVIRKHRVHKDYRVPKLDSQIRWTRTIREARIMYEACRVGVPTPSIYFIDLEASTIVMEYVEGNRVKDVVDSLSDQMQAKIFFRIGHQIATLHENDIIHGDLTTSNMILTPSGKIFFVDFGLAEFSPSVEDKGVDLHLMRRALESTHYRHSAECFKAIINGYKDTLGEDQSNEILKRVHEIELRGRYLKRRAEKNPANQRN